MNLNKRTSNKNPYNQPYPNQNKYYTKPFVQFQNNKHSLNLSSNSHLQNANTDIKFTNNNIKQQNNLIPIKENLYPRIVSQENQIVYIVPQRQKQPLQINQHLTNTNKQPIPYYHKMPNYYYKNLSRTENTKIQQSQYFPPNIGNNHQRNMSGMTNSLINARNQNFSQKSLILTPESKLLNCKIQCQSVQEKPSTLFSPNVKQSFNINSLNINSFHTQKSQGEKAQNNFNKLLNQVNFNDDKKNQIYQLNQFGLKKSVSLVQKSDIQIQIKSNMNLSQHKIKKKYPQLNQYGFQEHSKNNQQRVKYSLGSQQFQKKNQLQKFQGRKTIDDVKLLENQSSHSFKKKPNFGLLSFASEQQKKYKNICKNLNFDFKQQKQKQFCLQDFQKGKLLGKGKFGEVFLVKHKKTGFICALKVISKSVIKQQKVQNQIIRQLKIQSFIKHPNIVNSYGFFDDLQNVYVLLQLCSGGHLYKKIQKNRRVSQQQTSKIVKQICQGLKYLHLNGILHRDLKPQNIIIENQIAKICDFGWAVFASSGLRKTVCGTPLYLSPQIVKGEEYDQGSDIWAVGILTYEMLIGRIPFKIWTQFQLNKIVEDEVKFPDYVQVSDEAQDFILKTLEKDSRNRLSIQDLLNHKFLRNIKLEQNNLINELQYQ